MRVRRAVRCPTCGASYIEEEGGRCPVCERGRGVVRPLGGEADANAQAIPGGFAAQAQSRASAPLPRDEFVCGWLVVREGAQRGRSYRLTARKNAVPPRASPGAQAMHGASVLYDPVGNAFYALNADGPDLAYVNGDVLLTPRPLRAGDILRVGGTALRFVPFCGERFRWDVGAP